jgi:hypothetical protein
MGLSSPWYPIKMVKILIYARKLKENKEYLEKRARLVPHSSDYITVRKKKMHK